MKSAALIIVGKNEIQGINKLFKKFLKKFFTKSITLMEIPQMVHLNFLLHSKI